MMVLTETESPEAITNFHEYIKQFPYAVVDFSATWCRPCEALNKIFYLLSKDPRFKDVKFIKIVDHRDDKLTKELMDKLDIMGVPTVIFYRNGEEVHRIVGLVDKKRYEEKILELLSM